LSIYTYWAAYWYNFQCFLPQQQDLNGFQHMLKSKKKENFIFDTYIAAGWNDIL
jgi:hypothetical protein